MSAIARMLDANANRAREALRVMEDAARFALDDADLTAELKAIRHELRASLDELPAGWLAASRDTPGDVGTALSTDAERRRADLREIAIASGKRVTEALRVLEESVKAIRPAIAPRIEALRYRAYAVDAALAMRLPSGRARQWALCVLLTEAICRRPWREVLRGALEGGADCIQVREKDLPARLLTERVREVTRMCREQCGPQNHQTAVVVNDRADVAIAAGADGVHLGADDLSITDVRRIAGRELLVGASTHDMEEAATAVKAGADYCGVGTMFSSAVKPDRPLAGPAFLRAFVDAHPNVPHLAIGGITPENVDPIIRAGARGIAVSTALCAADDPAAVARRLREAVLAAAAE